MAEHTSSSGSVSEEDIRRLVDQFYARIRADPSLGPIFTRHVGDDEEAWAAHLAVLRNFWSSVMLTSGRYKGDPFSTHLRLEDIEPEMFDRWLALFGETCTTLFPDSRAALFQEKAQRIARSLRMGLFERLPMASPEVNRSSAGPEPKHASGEQKS